MRWKPAETIPLDGTEVLALLDRNGIRIEIDIIYYDNVYNGWIARSYFHINENHILGWYPIPKIPNPKHHCKHGDAECYEEMGELFFRFKFKKTNSKTALEETYCVGACPLCGYEIER